ncbi:MAG: hypothetical protein IJC77_06725, partial [Bacteroidaceae bacterium]|nr:hypothetical protein [Bacteroidaceae bacterium]
MPINYAVKKVTNPNGIEGTDYFHAQAIKTGELTLEKLARRINNSTTVTQADCRAVLVSMKDHIIEALTTTLLRSATTLHIIRTAHIQEHYAEHRNKKYPIFHNS